MIKILQMLNNHILIASHRSRLLLWSELLSSNTHERERERERERWKRGNKSHSVILHLTLIRDEIKSTTVYERERRRYTWQEITFLFHFIWLRNMRHIACHDNCDLGSISIYSYVCVAPHLFYIHAISDILSVTWILCSL